MTTLLPSTRLRACRACDELVKAGDVACPHCGAAQPGAPARARATLAGLVLASCIHVEAVYGVPTSASETDTDASTDASTSASSGGTTAEPATTTATTATESATGTSDGSSTGGSEAGTGTGTDGESSSDTGAEASTGSTTTAEPDYGVPSTMSG